MPSKTARVGRGPIERPSRATMLTTPRPSPLDSTDTMKDPVLPPIFISLGLLACLLACGSDEPVTPPQRPAGPDPVEVMVSTCLETVREQHYDDALSPCLQALQMDPDNVEVKAAVARSKRAIGDAGLDYAKSANSDALKQMEKDKSLEDAAVEHALSRTLWRCPPHGRLEVAYSIAAMTDESFTAMLSITNYDGAPLEGYAVTLELPAGIRLERGWDAEFSQSGNVVRAENGRESVGGKLKGSGGRVSFGFEGSHGGEAPTPASVELNGEPCVGGA